MQSTAATVDAYIEELSEERKQAIKKLRAVIHKNLPIGFKEVMSYGMIGYVVPHDIYPNGYHCNPKLPLPFLTIASQKNFIVMHHLGIYADTQLVDWLKESYAAAYDGKLDMGKGCLRFKNVEKIPYELIGELTKKITVAQWIALYEKNLLASKKK